MPGGGTPALAPMNAPGLVAMSPPSVAYAAGENATAAIPAAASVLIQKFESLQIRVAAPESCWTGKGISDGSSDGGTGSQRDRASGVEAAFVAAEDRAGVGAPRPHCS